MTNQGNESTQACSLTDFLLARITEDERLASEQSRPLADFYVPPRPGKLIYRTANTRALAECEAKRLIVEQHRWAMDVDWSRCGLRERTAWKGARSVMAALGRVYADHADYRAEWAR